MIVGTGIDIIEVSRIKKELSRLGRRFSQRIFTDQEIGYCEKGANLSVQSQRFAGRFSAKESFFKAIGSGLRHGFNWKDVEVVNNDQGKPSLILQNKALEIVQREEIKQIHLSISHCRAYAAAVVILEK
jgi:holo-[acyl-carrier protein] synthase